MLTQLPLPASAIKVAEARDRQALILSAAIHFSHISPHNSRFLCGLGGLPELTEIWRP
jgi:hypothetical protein